VEVILLERVGRLGTVGDRVNVKSGYGRNYLLPQGKAITATTPNIAAFETRRAELEKNAGERKMVATTRAAQLADLIVTITANAGDEGKLFGSVGARDIANAITAAGVEVVKAEVKLPAGTLREVGEYQVDLQLHDDIIQSVKIVIEAQ
jgi:large subunit ribosomal protein L9